MFFQKREYHFCFIGLLILLFNALTVGQTTVSVTPATSNVHIGETVTLNIVVDGVASLHGVHVVLTFDNTIVQCTGRAGGAFLESSGNPVFFTATPPPGPTVSSMTIDQAILGLGGVSGSGVLFSVTYIAVGAGTSPVVLSTVDLRDESNNHIPASVFPASVVVAPNIVTVQYPVLNLWNLVSVPLTVDDPRRSVLFPSATSLAYSFHPLMGYVSRDTLGNGAGYWLKFPLAQNVSMAGTVRVVDSVQVNAGWNIIGSISNPVPVASIQQIPAGIVISSFYGYNGAYVISDTLKPAKAYWVRVSQNGRLVLR